MKSTHMKHVSTQMAMKPSTKQRSTYGAFIVDTALDFDNFHIDRNVRKSSSTANFTRPLSVRPTYLSDDPDPRAVFGLPELSRQSSPASSWRDSGFYTASSTPLTETPPSTQHSAGSVTVLSDDGIRPQSAMEPSKYADQMSFMTLARSGSPDLDLAFPVERLFANPTEHPRSSLRSWNGGRLVSATGPIDINRTSLQDVTKVTWAKPPMTTLLSLESNNCLEPQSAPPNTTCFLESNQAQAERQDPEEAASIKSGPLSYTRPFLQQDPFKCPIHGDKRQIPKSTGVGVGASLLSQKADMIDEVNLEALVKKQSAPSVRSTKSTKSMKSTRKRFSRLKKMMRGPLNDDDDD